MEPRNLPSLNQPKTGLTEQVKQALAEVRIREMQDGWKMEVRKLLLELFALTGLKSENFPDEFQTELLIAFIREDLGNYSLKDFRIAFRLAIKGELDLDANHYQSFSASYLGKIILGYTQIRQRVRKSLQSNENVLKIESKSTMTQAEKDQLRKDYIFESIIKPWRYLLKTNQLTFGITPYSILYETLTSDLQILLLSVDEKKRIYEVAVANVLKNLDKPASNYDEHKRRQMVKEKIDKEGISKVMEYEIKTECYYLSVREFFENCKSNKIDLEALVNSKL